MYVISRINSLVFGPALFIAVFGAGAYLCARCGFFIFRRPARIMRSLSGRGGGSGISPFAAACTALAGTLGVGNIVGVATAVSIGGAGALFWMWISLGAAATLKYAEVALGVKYRLRRARKWHGGAPYYIEKAAGRPYAAVFAAACTAASFTLGNAVQVRAAAQAAQMAAGVPPVLTGGAIAALCFAVTFGGIGRISAFTGRMIPLLCGAFILMALIAIFAAADRIPAAFGEIFRSALDMRAGAGGMAGAAALRAARYGIARGLGSNEAGCGTSPTAYAAADAGSPADAGAWGVFEVAVDTGILCTLTGLVIVVNGTAGEGEGIAPVIAGLVPVFGGGAAGAVCVCVVFFALSTVMCWSYYGCEALEYLGAPETAKRVYLAVFFLVCAPLAAADTGLLWEISDLCVGVMTTLNAAVLCRTAGEVAALTRARFGGAKKAGSLPPRPYQE